MLGGRSAQGEPVPSKPWMVSCHDIYYRCRLGCILLKMAAISLSTGLSELRASLCESVCLPGSNEQVRAPQGWHYRDNDFFQELWMQLAASGTGQFCKRSNGLSTFTATVA